ncbi:hypothetical protein [Saccharothrix algeriensis]|uniref:Uncharacterized protein n=1 Tax=Saccharothrix algeriensis TaxID=173560 RepID=A0A8T8HRN8_9PSEU|nr:hypothetical protein [Saccharothrix algeriensis]MBM7812501.1 hypothetical protein [Saccharothrix algeriensis]QTR01233.1 hypothetical protein J7S33_17295 [Saccharothrix algeriensis]
MTNPDPGPQPAGATPTPPDDSPEAVSEAVADAAGGPPAPDPTGDPGRPASAPEQAASGQAAPEQAAPTAPADPQELFGSLSLAAIEADIDAMMNDKMTELDGMLAGLEELVVKLEGELTQLEAPPDDSPTP